MNTFKEATLSSVDNGCVLRILDDGYTLIINRYYDNKIDAHIFLMEYLLKETKLLTEETNVNK